MLRTVIGLASMTVVLALPWATPSWCQSMEELEVDHALTFQFSTPHTDWATPYANGTTRVLFFTTGHNTEPRECVELMQRFDLEAQAVFYATIVDSPQTHWHGADLGEQRMLNLLEKPWDCFVFLGLAPAKMSAEQMYKMLRQVVDGAGLVLAGADEPRVLKEKNRLTELPPFLARGPVGEAFTVGKGRAVRLPGRPNLDYYDGWEVDYDYWQERLGRAVLWAAGKEPRSSLGLQASATELAREHELVLTARVAGEIVGDQPRIYARLRPVQSEGLIEFEPAGAPVGSSHQWRVEAGTLRAGRYHFDVWLTSSAGTETWDTVPLTVTSARAVAELRLDREWGEIGDRMAGSVILSGDPLPDETVRVRLLDRRRRELVRADLAATADVASFSFPVERWLPMLVTVEAQLLSRGREVSRADRFFNVTKRHRDRWNFLIWDYPRGTLAPYAEESLAQTGMTLQLAWGAPPPYVAAYDVAWVPYTTRILASSKTPEGIMQPFCWNDRDAVQAHVQDLAEKHQQARQHGVFVYSLGDENDTLGACLSAHCARAYRQYLQEVYGSLEALNESWGTAFTSWEQVGLSKPDDNEEASSLQDGNYPRWFDRQAFKSYNYVNYCRKYAAAYRSIDPQARTGFEGAGGFATGDDLDLIVRSLEFWSPYPGTADEVIRSIAPPDFPSANWMGYTKDADSLLNRYWRMVTLGMDAVWWWRWDCIGAFHGWLAPDLRPYPAVQEIIKDTQVVRDGLGDLLLKSEMQDDGVGILFSYPSVFAHKLAEGASFGSYEAEHLLAHQTIRDRGLNFRYVTDRMLRLGEFDSSRYKLLVLPRAEALGDQEAAAIRSFVEGGGTVVADLRPGLYNDHCKPRQTGVLDDLFGIRRVGRPEALVIDAPGCWYDKAKVDTGIELDGGRAVMSLGGAPALIAHPVGRGMAYLLNFDMGHCRELLRARNAGQVRDTVLAALAGAGVAARLELRSASDPSSHPSEVAVTRWLNGNIEIISLFRQGGAREEVWVHLAEARHVYNLRDRAYLGLVTDWRMTVIPDRATFLALLPEPAPRPVIQLDPADAVRGSVVKGSLWVPGAQGQQAFRLRVHALSADGGDHLPWHDQVIVAGQEPVAFDLPIAYNDPAGTYAVSATDLFSNEETTAHVMVR